MGTHQDWAPLPFAFLPSWRSGRPCSRGPGPASLLECYGKRKRSIDFGVLFWKGVGCLGEWSVAGRMPPRESRLLKDAPPSGFFFLYLPQVMPALRGLIIEPPV